MEFHITKLCSLRSIKMKIDSINLNLIQELIKAEIRKEPSSVRNSIFKKISKEYKITVCLGCGKEDCGKCPCGTAQRLHDEVRRSFIDERISQE